jgi:hypothetical protein
MGGGGRGIATRSSTVLPERRRKIKEEKKKTACGTFSKLEYVLKMIGKSARRPRGEHRAKAAPSKRAHHKD